MVHTIWLNWTLVLYLAKNTFDGVANKMHIGSEKSERCAQPNESRNSAYRNANFRMDDVQATIALRVDKVNGVSIAGLK